MKRSRVRNHPDSTDYEPLSEDTGHLPMRRMRSPHVQTLEAQIQENDTLQAIALRFNCPLSELKRLNKIERDNEIFARSVLRIPVTPHTVLLETLPGVHKSGASSPTKTKAPPGSLAHSELDEKLIIASVSHSECIPTSINDIILSTKISTSEYRDEEGSVSDPLSEVDLDHQSLLSGAIDDTVPQPRIIPVRHRVDLTCNGADCDISWVFLFIFILLLCFAIPIIYIFFKTEPEHEHHVERLLHENHSKL
uniref:Putative peptidoglycan-binding protein n=1 Tax=Phlebotomus kandelakii TaxID=1109342 RepID=A0A6B2EDW8_9DIPT